MKNRPPTAPAGGSTRKSRLRLTCAALTWACLVWPSATLAQTTTCDPARTIQTLRAEAPASAREEYQGEASTCNGLFAVFSRLANRKISGGRKLEPDRPLDEAAAQAERRAALADPAYAAQLRKALGSEANPLRQTLIEAAVLHVNGHYAARDLLVRQAAREVNP